MSSGSYNILMTGGGAPGAAGILNCLKEENRFNILMVDANPGAIGNYLVDDFSVIPRGIDPGFIEKLTAICQQKKIDLVLPLVTSELILLATHQKQFEKNGTKIPISPAASLEIANNKSRLYQFLQWRNIPVPAFFVIETVEQFKEAVSELGYPRQRVCFKPSVSNGSRGFRVLSSQVDEADLLFNQKPQSTYMRYDDIVRILSAGPFPELLISEYLPGDEYSIDCLADHGESVLIVPRRRSKMIHGISVEGEFIRNDSIIDYCKKIIKELKLHGNIGIQVKQSSKDEFLILEINPRVQGTISACLGAGVNLPVLGIKQELGLPISEKETQVKWGTKFSRHWTEVFY